MIQQDKLWLGDVGGHPLVDIVFGQDGNLAQITDFVKTNCIFGASKRNFASNRMILMSFLQKSNSEKTW